MCENLFELTFWEEAARYEGFISLWGAEQKGETMTQITQLKVQEAVQVDHDRLGALYVRLGDYCAENVVCRAMEELALRMTHCDRLYRSEDYEELRKSARSLIAIAEQIGMLALARVAANVIECVDQGNTVALAATLERMLRTGEGSLTAVWSLQDITI